MAKTIKSCKTTSTEYDDLCKKCLTPHICLAFGIFDSCKPRVKKKK